MTMLPRLEGPRTTSQGRARLHVTADKIPAALCCKSARPLAARRRTPDAAEIPVPGLLEPRRKSKPARPSHRIRGRIMLRTAKPFPFYLSLYYIHPVTTKVRGRAYANICRGGKWLMSYQYHRFTDAVYFVRGLNARLREIC